MDVLPMIAMMAIVLVVMAWYANASKRNKIYCTFRRVNKTRITKFVKMSSRFVIFDGGKYDIIPSCVTWEWWDKGLIHMLFPQTVATMDYIYNNRYPIDPYTGKPTVISPAVRKALNKEEWVESYYKGARPSTAMKQNMIQQYLPWIAIVLVVLIGVYLYTNMQGVGAELANIKNTLNAITR